MKAALFLSEIATMKKVYFILLSFLSWGVSHKVSAQLPSINKTDFDSLRYAQYRYSSSIVALETIDTAADWQFNRLSNEGYMTTWSGEFIASQNSPGFLRFPNAHEVFSSAAGLNVYYNLNDNGVYEIGRWYNGNYMDFKGEPLKVLQFPFEEGDSFLHTSHGSGKWLSEGDTFIVQMKQKYLRSSDLYLPDHLFEDAILTKREVQFFDSSFTDSFWTRSNEEYWVWYASDGTNNGFNGVLIMARLTNWNSDADTSRGGMIIFYSDPKPNSILESTAYDMMVYPQPASEQFYIEFNPGEPIREVQRFNVGSGITSLDFRLSGNQCQIDCSHWSNGMYVIILSTESGRQYVKKVLVQN